MFGLKINKCINVGWLLLGDINTGSSRIHGINIHNYLISKNIGSRIVQSSKIMTSALTLSIWEQIHAIFSGIDILIFQKVFDNKAIRLANLAKFIGIKTVLIQCDLHETEMANTVDYVVVTSNYLKKHYDNLYGISSIVVEDAIEIDLTKSKQHEVKEDLKLVWVGNKDHWGTLDIVRDVLLNINDDAFSIYTISDHPDADVKWDLSTVTDEILKGDIAIIPTHNTPWYQSKSSNRLTMFMGLGLPVIASNIPSYSELITNNYNGYIATSSSEWKKYLLALKNHDLRTKIGRAAKQDVISKYSMDVIGEKWIELFYKFIRG